MQYREQIRGEFVYLYKVEHSLDDIEHWKGDFQNVKILGDCLQCKKNSQTWLKKDRILHLQACNIIHMFIISTFELYTCITMATQIDQVVDNDGINADDYHFNSLLGNIFGYSDADPKHESDNLESMMHLNCQ